MPTSPPRQDRTDIRETIDPESDVDEASLESFPASDSPGYTGGEATPDGSSSYSAEDAERARTRAERRASEDAPGDADR